MKDFFTSGIKNAISDLKELNAVLTEIQKTNDSLSKSDLSKISSDASRAAEKYGGKAADYLTAFR